MRVRYLHLPPGDELPELHDRSPFRAVVVLEQETSERWQERVGDWLLRSGCRYMMSWGSDCQAFHDIVDRARDAASRDVDMPDEQFLVTTWHEHEPLSETFWFAEHGANHPVVDLAETVIIHVAPRARGHGMIDAYLRAQRDAD